MKFFSKLIMMITLMAIEINTQCGKCNGVFYEVAPVCGLDGVTYKNKCYADCNEQGVKYYGACSSVALPCDCPSKSSPVYDLFGNQYENECVANCLGKVAISAKEGAFGPQSLPENKKYEPLVIRDLEGNNKNNAFKFNDYRLKDLSLFPADA